MSCDFVKGNRGGGLIIRKAEMNDYDAVAMLEELEFCAHLQARPDYFKSREISYPRTELEELLSLSSPISWLAVQNGKVIGLCFGKIDWTTENPVCQSRLVAFIQDLVTLPEYRRQGVAAALMAKAREQAVKQGAESIELCVWGFNEKARKLYEKLGMKVQYFRMEEAFIQK